MKAKITLLIFIIITMYSYAGVPSKLHPFRVNEKFGYINSEGAIIITPQFDNASDFCEGLAKVRVKTSFRYIDLKGTFIKGKYLSGESFSEGLARVKVKNNLYQFINRDGTIVLPPKKRYYSNIFVNGFLIVINEKKKKNIINKSGMLMLKDWYDDLKNFCNDIIPVKMNGKWGGMGLDEKMIIPAQFDGISEFSEHYATVRNEKGVAFIDSKGKLLNNTFYEDAKSFSEGLAAIKIDGKWGYINKKGVIVVEPAYYYVANYSEGLAAVCPFSEIQFFGFIDKSGKMIINSLFEESGVFKENICKILVIKGQVGVPRSEWCYINKAGKIIWESKYKACRISEKELVIIKEELGVIPK